ncbi:uncharacterized protein LOC110029215 [Phalaenopsis equestris]|uniref:uncharacterized protein LOC110029215 n=1 Tax=Phalaenopsis equestris TaxID=78828 RepID=UPI0009E5409D|nr:uncharacterized protein LOC110029215 [Phalaenopsis equestris]
MATDQLPHLHQFPPLNPRFKETLNLGCSRRRHETHGAGKIVYAADSIYRWWPVGAASNRDPIPAFFRLEPFDWEILEQRDGEKPLVLVGGGGSEENAGEGQDMTPWVSIAERVVPDLIAAAVTDVRISASSYVSKFFPFHGGSSGSLDSIKKAASTPVNSTNNLRKIFCTNVPHSHMENVQITVAPKIGLSFHSEKDHYHIRISDKHRPDSTITCKCTLTQSGQLKLHKIEENVVRHLVADLSCLYKKLDLRLFLFTGRKMKIIDNEENESLNKIVISAIIDPDVKGGLRWPMGKQSSAERYSVVGAWHQMCCFKER